MAGGSGGIRKRALLLVAIAALAAAVFATGLLHRAQAARPGASSHRLLLRLHDLPPGYLANLVSAETGPLDECGYLHPADAEPKLAAFIAQYAPKGCFAIYLRLYRAPGFGPAPLAVGTGALDADSTEAAEAGLAVAPEAIGHLGFERSLEEAAPIETIGEATRLFHWKQGSGAFSTGRTADSFLAWRSGSVVGVVFVEGRSFAASDQIATELAHRQQAHIEHPTPYTRAEQDDTEVPLDNPLLTTPVYWLDRRLEPGNGLPPTRLLATWVVTAPKIRSPHARVYLAYSRGLNVEVWKLSDWKRQRHAHPGFLIPARHCAKPRRIRLSRGYAVVYAGYRHNPSRCPARPPGVYSAQAHIGRVVVTVEAHATCAGCARRGGPYNSLRGMKAIVRGLRLRPRRIY